MSAVTERDVERRFVRLGEKHGARVVKLACPGSAGMPDRLVLHPGGATALVELKAPGNHPRPLQLRVFGRLADLGHPVAVIDSLEGAEAFWAEAGARDEATENVLLVRGRIRGLPGKAPRRADVLLDGDKQNNAPENLMMLPNQAEHARYHAKLKGGKL